MDLIVGVKSTPVSDAVLKLTSNAPFIERANLKYDLNPYDEYAIEAAVQLKEKFGGQVTALSVTDDMTSSGVRRVLAMGADRLIELRLPYVGLNDPLTIAQILAAELRQLPYDLILLGKQAIDTGNGSVGILLAQLLDLPCIVAATFLQVENRLVRATRELEEGLATFECILPAIITTEKGLNQPRYPSLKDLMAAKKKEVTVKVVSDPPASSQLKRLKTPPPRAAGKIYSDPTEAIPAVVSFLKSQGI